MERSRCIISIGILLLLAGAIGCTSDWDVVSSYKNTLGTTAHSHIMAFELPDSLSEAHPAIVFIHGGWYAGGDYTEFHDECQAAAKRGYVAVSIDYHLTPYQGNSDGEPWPAQLDDAKSAIQWLRGDHTIYYNGSFYHLNQIINPDAIGVAGISSGGHTALMLGLTNSSMNNPFYTYSSLADVQAVCSLAGATHFLSEYFEAQSYPSPKTYINAMLDPDPVIKSLGSCNTACTFENNCYCDEDTSECIKESVPDNSPSRLGLLAYCSPYYQFCTDPDASCSDSIVNTAPIMMMIGADDTVVPYTSQHVPFYDKLQGPKAEVVYCPDGSCVCGHSFAFHVSDRNERMFAFFDQYLK